jgi:hypothetical protein
MRIHVNELHAQINRRCFPTLSDSPDIGQSERPSGVVVCAENQNSPGCARRTQFETENL